MEDESPLPPSLTQPKRRAHACFMPRRRHVEAEEGWRRNKGVRGGARPHARGWAARQLRLGGCVRVCALPARIASTRARAVSHTKKDCGGRGIAALPLLCHVSASPRRRC
eukprot:6206548-Pleurochrysis_carterae.AAC.1